MALTVCELPRATKVINSGIAIGRKTDDVEAGMTGQGAFEEKDVVFRIVYEEEIADGGRGHAEGLAGDAMIEVGWGLEGKENKKVAP